MRLAQRERFPLKGAGAPRVDTRDGEITLKRRTFLTLAAGSVLAACSGGSRMVPPVVHWGEEGLRDGAFLHPRAIGVHEGEVYVIDKTGRIQVFTTTGELLRIWSTPRYDNGTPTAIAFHDDRVIIPDTHYSRILEYSPAGELLDEWGSYGSETDRFIYPTGLRRDTAGNYFISEYGENAERVHVFTRDHVFARQWGSHGTEDGQFNRAMALDLGPGGKIYVADTANHRVQVFTKDGSHVITYQQHGGQTLKYPHDLCVDEDAAVYVAEYGNHRITRIAPDGAFRFLGMPGRAAGAFNAPRGVAIADGKVYVADTDNHRIQVFPVEAFA